jgi:hypothetical protein
LLYGYVSGVERRWLAIVAVAGTKNNGVEQTSWSKVHPNATHFIRHLDREIKNCCTVYSFLAAFLKPTLIFQIEKKKRNDQFPGMIDMKRIATLGDGYTLGTEIDDESAFMGNGKKREGCGAR